MLKSGAALISFLSCLRMHDQCMMRAVQKACITHNRSICALLDADDHAHHRARDSARQEAETWRSLQQFSRNGLELTQKRLQSDSGSDAASPDPAAPAAPWLKRLWCVQRTPISAD